MLGLATVGIAATVAALVKGDCARKIAIFRLAMSCRSVNVCASTFAIGGIPARGCETILLGKDGDDRSDEDEADGLDVHCR